MSWRRASRRGYRAGKAARLPTLAIAAVLAMIPVGSLVGAPPAAALDTEPETGVEPTQAAPSAEGLLCRPGAYPGLVSFDTGSGLSLWSLETTGGKRWALLDAGASSLPTFPADATPRFGGSLGAGPVFAWRGCGAGCYQAERFADGAWAPLGEPLRARERGRLATTYAADGAPWVALIEPAQEDRRRVTAYRLEDGSWVAKGRLAVLAGGSPGLLAAPFAADSVVSGSGVFSPAAPPRHWLRGLPSVPTDREAVALPLGRQAAAALTSDGEVFLSPDRGASWSLSRYRPWRIGRVDVWKHGMDYSVDLPAGALGSELALAWFDRRPRKSPEIILTEQGPGDTGPRRLAEVGAGLTDAQGDVLEIGDLLRQVNGGWILVAGCAEREGESGLLLRRVPLGGPEEPRFLPLRSAAGG